MRILTVTVQCDFCDEQGPEDEFYHAEITLDGHRREMDLCTIHGNEILAASRNLGDDDRTCPTCSREFKNPRGLKNHMTRTGH